MGISGVLRVIAHRWYIAVLGLFLTAGLAWGAFTLFPPDYTSRGLILLIPPVTEEDGANPFLALGGLELPARVLVAAYSSNAMQEEIADYAPEAEVLVSMEESTRGPVIAVDVTDVTPDGALAALAYVADSLPVTLAQLQEEVAAPASSTVTSIPLTMDTESEADYGLLTRMLIVAAGIGLAATAGAIFLVESISSRPTRRRRRIRQTVSAAEQSDADFDDPIEFTPVLRPVPASPRPAVRSSRETGLDDDSLE